MHLEAVGAYNRRKHQTTKEIPMKLFMNFSGENPLLVNEISGDSEFSSTESIEIDNNADDQPALDPLNRTAITLIGEEESFESTSNTSANDAHINALKNSEKAAQRMIKNSTWINDTIPFKNGDSVLLENDFDTNIKTKKLPLNALANAKIYKVIEIRDVSFVNLQAYNNSNEIIKNVSINRLRKIETIEDSLKKRKNK